MVLKGVKIKSKIDISSEKSVAICYLGDRGAAFHTTSKQQAIIENVFKNLGYACDVYALEKTPFFCKKKYDVIFGFGTSWKILCQKNRDAIKILYATEAPPFVSLFNELYVHKRIKSKGLLSKVKASRTYRFYDDSDYLSSDGVIQLGSANAEILSLIYKNIDCDFNALRVVRPFGIRCDGIDFKKNKTKVYIWFGSSGVFHKGLDVAIACVSKIKDANLYVAGCSFKEYVEAGGGKGSDTFLGVLNPISCDFVKLMKEVSFCILPSASEGISTAVLTCMYHGVVPICSRNTNIEKEYYLNSGLNENSLLKALRIAESMTDQEFLERSARTLVYSKKFYNEICFEEDLKEALIDIWGL